MKEKYRRTPAIVLGCHKLGLGVIRALGECDIPIIGVFYNKNDMGYVSRYIRKSYLCPNPDLDEHGFIEHLRSLAGEWAGSVLIPSDDGTLIAVSKNIPLLADLYKVSACEWKIVKKCINKHETYALADEIGLLVPKTFIPDSPEEALQISEGMEFPCLLKPVVGHLYFESVRKKMAFVHNREELISEYQKAVSLGMKMMLQEYIPGDDTCGINYNSFFWDRKALVEFTAEKVRLSPPGFGFPRVAVSKNVPEVRELGSKLLSAIGFYGFSCMEFKKDIRTGKYRLMEINARQNLSSMLAVRAGINFPYISYIYADTGQLPNKNGSFKENIFWIDLEKDFIESFRSRKKERNSVNKLLFPYLKKHVFAVLSFKDPLPFLKRITDFCMIPVRKIFRHV